MYASKEDLDKIISSLQELQSKIQEDCPTQQLNKLQRYVYTSIRDASIRVSEIITFMMMNEGARNMPFAWSDLIPVRDALDTMLCSVEEGIRRADGTVKISLPIEELGLSARAYNILRRNDLCTVDDVLSYGRRKHLLSLRMMGMASYTEIVEKMEAAGINCNVLKD